MHRPLLVSLVAFVMIATSMAQQPPASQLTLRNLRAFARLYGYVRFFHPSDEASSIDWDRFAVLGARRVAAVRDRGELKRVLARLFCPLAPTLQICCPGEQPARLEVPAGDPGIVPVAWCHRGAGLSESRGTYGSARLNRPGKADYGSRAAFQRLGAEEVGDRLKLVARARTTCADTTSPPCMWVSARRGQDWKSLYRNLAEVPILSPGWKEYEAVVELPDSVEEVFVGGSLGNSGCLWMDDFSLSTSTAHGAWREVALEDAGLEADVSLLESEHWLISEDEVESVKADEGAYSGNRCLLLRPDTADVFNRLHAAPGEVLDKELAPGFRCRFPVVLYSQDGHTLPRGDEADLARLRAELDAVELDSMTGDDRDLRLAGVVIGWNVFQHFYPYFDVVDVDWDTMLTSLFREALSDTDALDYLFTLRRMTHALQDGHAGVSHDMTSALRGVPCLVDPVEGRAVVVVSRDTSGLRPGDVVLACDGTPVADRVAEVEAWRSGTSWYRRYGALRLLTHGPADEPAHVLVERNGDTLSIDAQRGDDRSVYPDEGAPIRELEPGYWFVDLNRASMPSIDSVMEVLATARGVVFDLRWYPASNDGLLRHLTDVPLRSARWNVPVMAYPDRERVVDWDTSGRWTLRPEEPRIKGRVAFLISGRAISYAESVLGIVEHYRLGELVGETTAGTNGNVNPFDLPGGYNVWWTGMKVLKHDGSQHHLIGIRPTVPVKRTLKAVREGRDEYIEKALEVIKS